MAGGWVWVWVWGVLPAENTEPIDPKLPEEICLPPKLSDSARVGGDRDPGPNGGLTDAGEAHSAAAGVLRRGAFGARGGGF